MTTSKKPISGTAIITKVGNANISPALLERAGFAFGDQIELRVSGEGEILIQRLTESSQN